MSTPQVFVNFYTSASISGNEATLEADLLADIRAASTNIKDEGVCIVKVAGSLNMKINGGSSCAYLEVIGDIQPALSPEAIAIFKKDALAHILSVTSVANINTMFVFQDSIAIQG